MFITWTSPLSSLEGIPPLFALAVVVLGSVSSLAPKISCVSPSHLLRFLGFGYLGDWGQGLEKSWTKSAFWNFS